MKYTPKTPVNPNIDSRSAAGHLFVLVRLCLLVGLLYFIAVAGLNWLGRQISVSREVSLLHNMVSSAMSPGVSEADPRSKRIKGIYKRLLEVSQVRDSAVELRVVESALENAFAVPGGFIVVNTALFDNCASENELAMVVAHELGHVINRDVTANLGRVLIALTFAIVTGQEGGVGAAIMESGMKLQLAYSRGQESAADEVALHLLNTAYGHVGGATAFFERDQVNDGWGLTVVDRTHPLSRDRVARLKQLIADRGYAVLPVLPLK